MADDTQEQPAQEQEPDFEVLPVKRTNDTGWQAVVRPEERVFAATLIYGAPVLRSHMPELPVMNNFELNKFA